MKNILFLLSLSVLLTFFSGCVLSPVEQQVQQTKIPLIKQTKVLKPVQSELQKDAPIPNQRGSAGVASISNAVQIQKVYTKRHALVIGINAYPSMPLEAAVADAEAVSKRLKELNFEVTVLLDREATAQNIRSELGTRFARTTKDEQVLIYFAGHGVTERLHDKQLEGYILPVDVNLKDLYATAISMKELRDLTKRIPAKHILYLFDSCYSGLGLTRSVKRPIQSPEDLTKLAGERAAYMITAGTGGEVAREISGHGVFTLHLLDGIAGAADVGPKDGIVQASELGIYLARVVSKDTGGEQNPQHGLFEGDGDFLFPLHDDDPIRLKESQLAKLEFQSQELGKRKNLQAEIDAFAQKLKESESVLRDEYTQEIAKLDQKIQKKQAEIEALSQAVPVASQGNLNRQRYSVMKFINTGIEFDILKTFPTLQEANAYYSKVFGIKVKLDGRGYSKHLPYKIKKKIKDTLRKENNKYHTKVTSYSGSGIPMKRRDTSFNNNGIITHIRISTQTPSQILRNIRHISSPLRSDQTTFVEFIELQIGEITSNHKLLTFDQITNRLISRYGKPTSKGKVIKLKNWKTGNDDKHNVLIWKNEKVLLTVGRCGYGNCIKITLKSLSPILPSIFSQVYKIFEAEELVLLKQRIEKMAEIERARKASANKRLNF